MILTIYNEYIYNDAVTAKLAGYHYRSFTLQIYNCLICNVYSSRTIENASSDQETKSRHIVFAHRINGRESTRWFL